MDNAKYLDRIKKASYYKEVLTKSFLSNGIFPDSLEIEKRLSEIDLSLSIFKASPVVSGDYFDTDKFNGAMLNIMQDLQILYETAYQICVKDYNEMKSFVDSHLAELEHLAERYDYYAKYEIGSTALGETVFCQTSDFKLSIDNKTVTIDLGKIKAHNGSKLACIFDANGIAPEQVFFSFNGEYCSPYSLHRDYKIVGGNVNCTKYEISVSDDTAVNSACPLVSDDLVVSPNNKYIIYGGKNQIQCSNPISFLNFESDKVILLEQGNTASFYILNGNYANFDFSKQPLRTNFEGTSIRGLDSHHLIQISYAAPFALSVNTDGNIYATKQIGLIKDNILYYPKIHQVYQFLVEEYDTNAVTEYDAKVIINDYNSDIPLKINLVAVKELSTLEGI